MPRRAILIRVSVRAHPGAREEQVRLLDGGLLEVRVRAPALDGRANEAITSAVAGALGLRRREVKLVSGARSRDKLLQIALGSPDELRERLAASGPKGKPH